MATGTNRKSSSAKKGNSRSKVSGSASRKNVSKKNNNSRNVRPQWQDDGIMDEIVLLIVIAVSAIMLLSNFKLMGSFGQKISGVMYGLFGIVSYLVPIALFLTAAFCVSNKGMPVATVKLVSAVVFVITLCSFAQLMFYKDAEVESIFDYYSLCSTNKKGGGLFGGILPHILCNNGKGIGIIGAYIVLIILLIISGVLITEKSFFGGVKKGGEALYYSAREDAYRRKEMHQIRMQNAEIKREEKLRRREERLERDRIAREEHERRLAENKEKAEKMLRSDKKVSGVMTDVQLYSPNSSSGEMKEIVIEPDAFDINDIDYKNDHSISINNTSENNMVSNNDSLNNGYLKNDGYEDEISVDFGQDFVSIGNLDRETDNSSFLDMEILKSEDVKEESPFGKGVPIFDDRTSRPEPERKRYSSGIISLPIAGKDDAPISNRHHINLNEVKISEQEVYERDVDTIYEIIPEREDLTAKYRDENQFRDDTDGVSDHELEEMLEGILMPNIPKFNRGSDSSLNNASVKTEEENNIENELQKSILRSLEEPVMKETVEESVIKDSIIEESYTEKEDIEEAIDYNYNDEPNIKSSYSLESYTAKESLENNKPKVIENREFDRPEIPVNDSRPKAIKPEANPIKRAIDKLSNSDHDNYQYPSPELLTPGKGGQMCDKEELHKKALKLQDTLLSFGIKVSVIDEIQGPTVTRFEMKPDQGVKVAKITNLADDICLNMEAKSVRIEAPIPGKAAVGIEIPNKSTSAIMFRDLIEDNAFTSAQSKITFAVGKDIGGQVVVADIAKMPHLLIAGATGSGKSVCINTLIMSILYKAHPDDVKLIMIDPKVVELSVYNGIPHLMVPVVTDPKKAAAALNWGVSEMMDRYAKFAEFGVRDLKGYNKKLESTYDDPDIPEEDRPKKLPQLVIIVDELADLMMVASKEVEGSICRLAQLARAAGIHLVIATQRPSVDVITGLIKANMPSRVAFRVSSGIDSRTILDTIGAEKLLGNGDMLFYPQGYSKPARIQGAFVSDKEVADVVEYLKSQFDGHVYSSEVEAKISAGASGSTGGTGAGTSLAEDDGDNGRDNLYTLAGQFIIETDKASIGALQRKFKIGFNRAARIMDQLADDGVVSTGEGTKPRTVVMSMEQFEEFVEDYV